MTEQILTIEQMQELKELGIDTSGASMCWSGSETWMTDHWEVPEYKPRVNNKPIHGQLETIPAFTLQDILRILPKPCYINCIDEDFYQCECGRTAGLVSNTSASGRNPLIAAFNMLRHCKQLNYI